MSRSNPQYPFAPDVDHEAQARALVDYHRRLEGAGIDPNDDPPADMDAFRDRLTRRIAMFLNTWQGCPETLCRRQRGCMAPNSLCSNARLEPDPDGTLWDEARIGTRLALDEWKAANGLQDD